LQRIECIQRSSYKNIAWITNYLKTSMEVTKPVLLFFLDIWNCGNFKGTQNVIIFLVIFLFQSTKQKVFKTFLLGYFFGWYFKTNLVCFFWFTCYTEKGWTKKTSQIRLKIVSKKINTFCLVWWNQKISAFCFLAEN
jgi:hypothetical protein